MSSTYFHKWSVQNKRSNGKGTISRVCFVLLLWCSIYANVSSQPLNLDSLWSRWNNKSLPDTARLNALLGISEAEQNINADTVFVHAQMGYQFAEMRNLAGYKMKFLFQMGRSRIQAGALGAAETFTKRSMALAESLHDDEYHAKCLNLLGATYKSQGDYAASVEFHLRASQLAEKLKDQKLLLATYLNLGNTYMGLKESDKYLHYSQEYLKLAEATRDTPAISIGLSCLGIAYHTLKNLPEALKYYTLGLQMAKAAGITRSSGTSYMQIGDVYALMDEPALAIGKYRTAMGEYQAKGNKLGQAQTLYRIAKLYKTQFPDSTLFLAQRALEMAKVVDRKVLIANIALLLHDTYEARGQYQPALEMHKLYCQTQDSIFSQEQLQSIARSEAKYEYEKKQLEDRIAFEQELAQTRFNAQRRFFALLGLLVLLIAGGALYSYNRNFKYKTERAEALLKISQLRESVAKQTLSASGLGEKPILNKEKIEAAVSSRLGDTSWNILQLLTESPTISNHQIAESLYLSEEGVSSSLRRMYSVFDIQSGNSKNHKIALLSKAVELSFSE